MTFFQISFNSLNLFSFILGGIWGLSTGAFNRHRNWWVIVLYFVFVAFYYAHSAGLIKNDSMPFVNQSNSSQIG